MLNLILIAKRQGEIARGMAAAEAAGCAGAVARLQQEREQIARILCNAQASDFNPNDPKTWIRMEG